MIIIVRQWQTKDIFKIAQLTRDAIHTHFVTLIGKWTIVGGWVKHLADKGGKVGVTRLPKILGYDKDLWLR